MNTIRQTLLTAGLGLLVSTAGCSSMPALFPSPTPVLDAAFGNAVRAALTAQTLDPQAGLNTDPIRDIDGESAKNAIDRYQNSFKQPPRTFNVLGIGGSLGDTTNSR